MNKRKKNKINISKNKYNLLELLLVCGLALVIGLLLGDILFSSAVKNNKLSKAEYVYDTIMNEYINDVDQKTLEEGAINGMLASLKDKHSMYFNEVETDDFEIEMNGYFYGIGIVIDKKEKQYPVIYHVYDNSPAKKVGLNLNDRIIKVDGEDVKELDSQDIVKKIRGIPGKEYELTILREKEEKVFKIETGLVEIPSVEFKKLDEKTGYIILSVFADNTDVQLKQKLDEAHKNGINNIILDLRYNFGGTLDSVVNIGSLFLDKDTPIIRIVSKDKEDVIVSKGGNRKYNLVVLINEYTASASEVLAASLNENLGSPLIGTTTYGKGTMQKTKQLPSGELFKYTTQTWKTSKGNSIEGKGVKPTIEIKQNSNYFKTLKDEDDIQLQKALDTFK